MKNSLVALALSVAPAIAIPPADFGFPTSANDTPLSVVYSSNNTVQILQPGSLYGIDIPAQQPQVLVNETYDSLADYNGTYLLFMVDPDASYPENPTSRFIIHWWQEGLTKDPNNNNLIQGGQLLINNTAPRVAYRRPRPPTNSSAHRYIQYLFEQPDNFQIPPQYSGYNSTNATRFPFVQFLSDANLDAPVAANYFYCSNQTSVPATFVAAPGGQYPGGNGAMITQGTNEPSSTSGSSTPAATSSGATSTGSSTGPAVATYTASPAAGTMLKAEHAALGMVLAIGGALALL